MLWDLVSSSLWVGELHFEQLVPDWTGFSGGVASGMG